MSGFHDSPSDAAHASVGWRRHVQRAAWVALVLWLFACQSPEQALAGRWREAEWRYERADLPDGAQQAWSDQAALARQRDRRVVRHEAEFWEFRGDGTLIIGRRAAPPVRARWHLKGRGQVLTIHGHDGESVEVYDIKELAPDELVLHYDIGMEVRGIARLRFRRSTIAREAESVATARH